MHYLDAAYRPACARFGLRFTLDLVRPGYFPKGGGEVVATLEPLGEAGLRGTRMMERGALVEAVVLGYYSDLPVHVGERSVNEAEKRLRGVCRARDIKLVTRHEQAPPARNPGGVALAAARFQHGMAAYQAVAKRGRAAEDLGREVGEALAAFLSHGEPSPTVDAKLADQLLLPAAFAAGETTLRTERVTRHLTSNAQILRCFAPCEIEIAGNDDEPNVAVSVRGPQSTSEAIF